MATVWQRTNTLLLLLVLLALLAVIAMLALRAEGGPLDPSGAPASTDSVRLPGTPITGQTTISTPGHYYLTRNITFNGAGTVITIASSKVSLDLGGFTVGGNDAVGSIGISTSAGVEDIEITHGNVRDFQIAVSTASAKDARTDDVHVMSNVRGFQIGDRSKLSNCSALSGTETGIYVPGYGSVVERCIVADNEGDGISLTGSFDEVRDSKLLANNPNAGGDHVNIRMTGSNSVVRDNTVSAGNIRLESWPESVLDNECDNGLIVDVSPNPGGNRKAATDHLNVGC